MSSNLSKRSILICHNAVHSQGSFYVVAKRAKSSRYTEAVDALQSLQHNKVRLNPHQRDNALREAFHIFRSIHTEADHRAINPLLKLCLIHKSPDRVLSLWKDIKSKPFNSSTYSLLIQCCKATLKSNTRKSAEILRILQTLHGPVLNRNDLSTKSNLIKTYSLCSDRPNITNKALEIFHSIPNGQKSVITVGAMMKCCIHSNDSSHNTTALEIYDSNSSLHDDVMHLLALKACINSNNRTTGLRIISSLNSIDFLNSQNLKLINTMIDFYGHFGDIEAAQIIFDRIPNSKLNVVCIGSMMKVFVNNDENKNAMELYHRFGSLHNDITNLLALKAVVHLNDYEAGKRIVQNEINPKVQSLELQNSMINFFGHFGDLESAEKVFAAIKRKNVTVLNCMMQSYIHCEEYQKALLLYDEYRHSVPGLLTNEISLMLVLKATMKSTDSNAFQRGQEIYEFATSSKLRENMLLRTALIDFYGHFGDVETAENIFHSIPENKRDVVCIGAMMKCLVNNGQYEKVLVLYDEYSSMNDNASHVLAIKACAKLKCFDKGRQIIDSLSLNPLDVDSGSNDLYPFNESNILLLNTLIDFYGESAEIETAERIFEFIPKDKRDVVAVNAMMNAYFTNELDAKCIHLFYRLLDDPNCEGLEANNISYAIVLKSCAQSTALHHGQTIHRYLIGSELLKDLSVQINLMNFYGKCGVMTECEAIFKEIERSEHEKYCTEINLWNIMIHSYSRNGDIGAAMEMFAAMRMDVGLEPDRKTLILMINGFSYSGNVEGAMKLWREIGDENIKYEEFVISTMIDCLSRNNEVEKAYELIVEYDERNGQGSNEVMWMSLMNGCRASNNVKIAKICHEQFLNRFGDSTAYLSSATVLMSNIERLSLEH